MNVKKLRNLLSMIPDDYEVIVEGTDVENLFDISYRLNGNMELKSDKERKIVVLYGNETK